MPRQKSRYELSKPEFDYIREHYPPVFLAAARQRLCTNCLRSPCPLLPLTTEGKDCPYYEVSYVPRP